uniref:Copper transport protein n=1 Tax=Graphocephala atropunctata TaxID=36148 RepID=A0A1B6MRC4_9HEMI
MSESHHMEHHPGHVMDHGMMNHGMDHSGHGGMAQALDTPASHASMDHGSMMMHMMTFHFGYTETILFDFWNISSVGGLIGSMFGIFFMAALYEGLKYYREYLFWKTYNSLQYRSVEAPVNKNTVPENNSVAHSPGGCHRVLPLRLEEVCHHRCYGTLSLTYAPVP